MECTPQQPFLGFMLTLIIFCAVSTCEGTFSFSDASLLEAPAAPKDLKSQQWSAHSPEVQDIISASAGSWNKRAAQVRSKAVTSAFRHVHQLVIPCIKHEVNSRLPATEDWWHPHRQHRYLWLTVSLAHLSFNPCSPTYSVNMLLWSPLCSFPWSYWYLSSCLTEPKITLGTCYVTSHYCDKAENSLLGHKFCSSTNAAPN